MPNVLNEFEGDGVTRTFNFSMTGGYLSRDYVFFYTRPNEDLLAYTPYDDDDVTWISDYTVRTATPIPVGTTFVILRSTTLEPLVDFQNTSRITEKNLDTATWQSIHIAAETSDVVSRIREVATDAKLESAEALLSAQAAASDAQTASSAAVAAVQAASAAQAAALQAGADAEAAALSAQAAADTAAAAEDTANDAASEAATAVSTANSAVSTANSAVSTANSAMATANTAVSTANSASTTAGTAASAASSAVATANSAVGAANTAVGTANNAMSVANEAKSLIDDVVAGGVVSFNGRSGSVTPQAGDYTKAQVGLGNVDNTSDADKPLSTAAVSALAYAVYALEAKADKTYVDTQLSNNSTADRSRSNHTGNQAISTITGLQSALDSKVAKVAGKQLSTEDYTSAEKSKLSGVAAGATANSPDYNLRDRSTHTGQQPLSTLSQSGAEVGQVPKWTGSEWVPSGPDPTRAPAVHGHAISDVSGLQAALDSKMPADAVVVPPRGMQVFTASGNFTVPNGITALKVRGCGGGSGGGDYRGAGGTTSFGSYCTATGGSSSAPGTATGGDLNFTGGKGGTTGNATGTNAGGGVVGGGHGLSNMSASPTGLLGGTGGTRNITDATGYGNGGGASYSGSARAAGDAGGYFEKYITGLTPGTVINVVVGAGGAKGSSGSNGSPGIVIVEW